MILGTDFLKRYEVEIRFAFDMLVFHDEDKERYPVPMERELSLRQQKVRGDKIKAERLSPQESEDRAIERLLEKINLCTRRSLKWETFFGRGKQGEEEVDTHQAEACASVEEEAVWQVSCNGEQELLQPEWSAQPEEEEEESSVGETQPDNEVEEEEEEPAPTSNRKRIYFFGRVPSPNQEEEMGLVHGNNPSQPILKVEMDWEEDEGEVTGWVGYCEEDIA